MDTVHWRTVLTNTCAHPFPPSPSPFCVSFLFFFLYTSFRTVPFLPPPPPALDFFTFGFFFFFFFRPVASAWCYTN